MTTYTELTACTPLALTPDGFNPQTILPYGLEAAHIKSAMLDFLDFIGFINVQLHTHGIQRIETIMMQANFSSVVGEFMSAAIPKHCPALVKNAYHNGHQIWFPLACL